MEILKIQPANTSDIDQSISQTVNSSVNYETIQTTPDSTIDNDHTNQIWIKRTVPITANSNLYRRQHYRSALHQRSLNSSGKGLFDSSKNINNSFIKQTCSNNNLSSSPISNNKTNLLQLNSNISLMSSRVIVTDYRQSMLMKRIVNP